MVWQSGFARLRTLRPRFFHFTAFAAVGFVGCGYTLQILANFDSVRLIIDFRLYAFKFPCKIQRSFCDFLVRRKPAILIQLRTSSLSQHTVTSIMTFRTEICTGDQICAAAENSTCQQLNCDERYLVRGRQLAPAVEAAGAGEEARKPAIHFGLIASGDTVMKSEIGILSLSCILTEQSSKIGMSWLLPGPVSSGKLGKCGNKLASQAPINTENWRQYLMLSYAGRVIKFATEAAGVFYRQNVFEINILNVPSFIWMLKQLFSMTWVAEATKKKVVIIKQSKDNTTTFKNQTSRLNNVPVQREVARNYRETLYIFFHRP